MKIPTELRERLRSLLWERADELDWMHLSPSDKSRHYDQWARDPDIGGTLERYMAQQDVRMYLKNSLMGGYSQAKLSDIERPLRVLRLEPDLVDERFTKPLGCRLNDGRLLAWGKASSWKTILLSLHERAFKRDSASPFGVVFFSSSGRYKQELTRSLVEDAASKLGIDEVRWLET